MKLICLFLACAFSLPAADYFLTVAGLGGEPEYETQFVKWANDLDKELKVNGPETHVTTISGPAATRAGIEQAITRLAGEVKPTDTFALFLIGHGSFDDTDYKINLPGPDLTGGELAALLDRIPAHRQLVVNMTSCSGASLANLAKKDRVVITATKTGTEKNAPVFARYWVDALRDPAADTDKNGTVSALEAFRYTDRKVSAYFETEKLLATEHPLLTDTGKAAAVRDPKAENGNGLLASAFPLIRPEPDAAKAVTPEKQRLLARKQDLEARIDRLKYQKVAMEAAEYRQQLTSLLLELARTQAELDK